MKKAKKTGPSFWISPQENFLDLPLIKFLGKIKPRRCNSGVISPSRPSLGKVKSEVKMKTRQASPKPAKSKKNQGGNGKVVKKKGKKKVGLGGRKKGLSENKLVDLKGSIKVKAPKIFENQIFRDVFDEAGNHDRVMETLDISLTLPEILHETDFPPGTLIPPKDLDKYLSQYDQNPLVKNPGCSFLQETKDCNQLNYQDLFKKLSLLTQD